MSLASSQLTVPNRIEHLSAIVAYVQELARNAGFSDKEIGQIHLAVEEAVTNVIRHGLEMNPDESFTIVCEQTDADLTIRIQEKGVPFDPARMPVYSPAAPLEQSAGLGAFLMQQSMDEIHYVNRGKQGMEVSLVKRLRRRRIDERLTPQERASFQDAAPAAIMPHYVVRAMRPEEAVEVSKCAYRAYGYTYAEYIYFPEKIVESNENGTMASFVAVADDGELMGHTALRFAFPGAAIAEVGVAFVKPAFRRMGLLKQLVVCAIQEAAERGLAGVSARAVSSHSASQKTSLENGFVECGIMLAAMPEDVEFKKLVGRVSQRETDILMFLPLRKSEPVMLYPPTPYKETVERVYGRMGLPVVFGDPVAERPVNAGEAPEIRSSVNSPWRRAELMVVEYGDGDFGALHHLWRRLCLEKIDVFYLFLNMEDPRCPAFAEKCRALGFFLVGVLPKGVGDRHALVLQYLNNLKMDYARIKPYSSEGRALLSDVLAGAPESEAAESGTSRGR